MMLTMVMLALKIMLPVKVRHSQLVNNHPFIDSTHILLNARNSSWWIIINHYAENAEAAAPENQQGKKLVISDEYYQRVTRALVMRLRQHEETVMREGDHH